MSSNAAARVPASLRIGALHSLPSATAEPDRERRWTLRLAGQLPLLVVLIGACVFAITLYSQFLTLARERWNVPFHDRNAHYLLGVNLALHIEEGDLLGVFRDLNRARVWPPLHGVLLAGVLLVGGVDYRLGVLPSLAAWAGSVVLMFLVTRRALPKLGNIGGVLAAVLFLASPAHRAYATDVMLESLGTFLTLLVLYWYLRARQTGSCWAWRALGVSLTLLFVEKYNYWGLAFAAVMLAEFLAHRSILWDRFRASLSLADWKHQLGRQLRAPLNYLVVLLCLLAVAIAITGGTTFEIAGRHLSVKSVTNVVYAAYVVLLLRGLLWWRSHGGNALSHWPTPWRIILVWHALPVGLWFLWPNRLANFLWVMGPTNVEKSRSWSLLASLESNIRAFSFDYSPDAGLAVALVALAALGALFVRRVQPGSVAVLALTLLAAVATLMHPNQKARFLHTWLPAVWILAATGAVFVLSNRWLARRPRAPALAGGVLCAAAGVWLVMTQMNLGRAQDQKPLGEQVSDFDLSDYYLAETADCQRPAFFANVPMQQFFQWTYLEARRGQRSYEVEIKGLGLDAAANEQRFEAWAAATSCDVLVFIDRPLGPGLSLLPDAIPYEQLRHWLEKQQVFQLADRRQFSGQPCTVSVWRRAHR